MSGIPPYAYLCLADLGLVALGDDALQYLYDGASLNIVDVGDADFFEAGCVAVRYVDGREEREHPVGSYNISYPYCRTAFRYNMSDLRADPQLGQLVIALPYTSIKIMLEGCDQSAPISVAVKVEPPATKMCGAELFPGYSPTEFYLVIDRLAVLLPARVTFTITNANGKTKAFWVGLRDQRGGLPSGAVI